MLISKYQHRCAWLSTSALSLVFAKFGRTASQVLFVRTNFFIFFQLRAWEINFGCREERNTCPAYMEHSILVPQLFCTGASRQRLDNMSDWNAVCPRGLRFLVLADGGCDGDRPAQLRFSHQMKLLSSTRSTLCKKSCMEALVEKAADPSLDIAPANLQSCPRLAMRRSISRSGSSRSPSARWCPWMTTQIWTSRRNAL